MQEYWVNVYHNGKHGYPRSTLRNAKFYDYECGTVAYRIHVKMKPVKPINKPKYADFDRNPNWMTI